MHKQITVKTLKEQGSRNTEIAATIQCHRNTVSNILARGKFVEKQTREKSSSFDTYHDRIQTYLQKEKLTRLRIWEKLQQEYSISQKYDTLCKYIQIHFGGTNTAYVVQVVSPGEVAEVDFGYLGRVTDRDGRLRKAYVFVMVLGYSRKAFYGITYDQTIETFIKIHIKGFMYFGGVPKKVKADNLKAAVLRNRRYELEMNSDFLLFASHYGFVLTPCTPYQPQQKGKVESGVNYVKENFWAGRTFANGDDLEKQLEHWMDHIANARVHGTTKKIPAEVFLTEEQGTLRSLPETPYLFYQTVRRIVKPNCHVSFENNYYSVPCRFVGQEVELRWQDALVKIYGNHAEIAVHVRSEATGEYITTPSHYPDYKIYSETTHQQKYEEKMRMIGIHAHTFFTRVLIENPQGWNGIIRGIQGLVATYGAVKVEKAIRRALHFNALTLGTIKRICEKNLEDMELEPQLLPTQPIPKTESDVSPFGVSGAEVPHVPLSVETLPIETLPIETPTRTIPVPADDTGLERDLRYYAIS